MSEGTADQADPTGGDTGSGTGDIGEPSPSSDGAVDNKLHADLAELTPYVGGKAHVLVTGGTGYIGSHTTLMLLEAGNEVTVMDSLVNSSAESLKRVIKLAVDGGCADAAARLHFVELDLCNADDLEAVFSKIPKVDSCIHFAGLKAVGESTKEPILYYEKNVGGCVKLLDAMARHGVKNIVFSSSATVYGSAAVPINEDSPVGIGITNAYGRSKYMIEEILGDLGRSPAGAAWGICVLRYFNPVGAHPSGEIGEDPNGPPNNLMPYVSQVAVGRREFLSVYGSDYETPDGTGVRDYIHVMDLAQGHLNALDYLSKNGAGHYTFNLGTGKGYSVLEMVAAMSKACGHEIAYKVVDRRPGDLAVVYADTAKAASELGWTAKLGLDEMCRDLWAWQSANPNGFAKK